MQIVSSIPDIQLVTNDDFARESRSVYTAIGHPYTSSEIVRAKSAFTKKIWDCTAGGITDVDSVTMYHLSSDNFDYCPKIYRTLEKKVSIGDKNLSGLVAGAYDGGRSIKFFECMEKFMQMHNIPYSVLKQHRAYNPNTEIMYKSSVKQWFITNPEISRSIFEQRNYARNMTFADVQDFTMELLKKVFKTVVIDGATLSSKMSRF